MSNLESFDTLEEAIAFLGNGPGDVRNANGEIVIYKADA